MSYSTKALSLFVVLPLILKNFPLGDVSLWYLFFTIIISSQNISEFGFRQTFSRIISYAYVGAEDIGQFKNDTSVKAGIEKEQPNVALLSDVVSTMKYIYARLTILFFVLMVGFGTWSLITPVKQASNITQTWWAWAVVVVASCINFYGKIYVNYLEGLFKVAVVRRIETLTSLGAIISSISILIISPSLLHLIIANQFWILVNTVRDIYLCYTLEGGLYKSVSKQQPFNKSIFKKIWEPTWKNGISGFVAIGVTNLNGVFFAQVGSPAEVAGYLLALRIINQIKDISMAPFYSKLPLMAMLRVKNNLQELIKISKRGMFLSHLTFIIGVVGVGVFSNYLLHFLGSHVNFVAPKLWLLISLGFFFQRFGAMHMQVYISTNHVIIHVADIVSGTIYVLVTLLLFKFIGVYALAVAMIAGYLGFYSWYAAKNSYRSLGLGFGSFERSTLAMPLLILLPYLYVVVFTNYLK
ncbi:hypothetical protein GCM10027037_35220 [Mucilaginibacter koreensis]